MIGGRLPRQPGPKNYPLVHQSNICGRITPVDSRGFFGGLEEGYAQGVNILLEKGDRNQ